MLMAFVQLLHVRYQARKKKQQITLKCMVKQLHCGCGIPLTHA